MTVRFGRRRWLTVGVVALLGLALAGPATADPRHDPTESSAEYVLSGPLTRDRVNAVASTGASVDHVEGGRISVTATPSELREILKLGFTAQKVTPPADRGKAAIDDFPSADSNYHNYAELTTEVNNLVASKPAIAKKYSLGTSYEGRDLMLVKISDNVATDEDEPEVLFDAHQHAREHLTVEMSVYLLHLFIDNYGTDPRITNLVNTREIWVIPDMNPDGGEYDIASGSYRSWRKNRQPNAGSSNVGTDPNRNWSYNWGCCNGSSGSTSSETYRGPSAFSAPETKKVSDWVLSRVVGGKQQIRVGIDFHTYGELVLWPFGYTTNHTPSGMSADDNATFSTIGQQMAGTNNYLPEQSADDYITDGDILDWMWGSQKIFAYTFEMYGGNYGFYPPDEVIPAQTSRNKEAVLKLVEYADCPQRSIGKEQQYCGTTTPPGPRFENGTDVAIPDNTTVESPITVTGVSDRTTVTVNVDIKHTYRGDLVVSLVKPDGTVVVLEDFPNGDSADNVLKSYSATVPAAANGVWKLRVQDIASADTGRIDIWSLQF
ncbi:M14 family zinc carboxypeptidase [Longispora sp. K20-0274]|uniref:M14 family zinc carboxypeptidase n=1 Tax=Longispora sp. K20-0274 TaxID=3088255 RepID=UPI00399C3B29